MTVLRTLARTGEALLVAAAVMIAPSGSASTDGSTNQWEASPSRTLFSRPVPAPIPASAGRFKYYYAEAHQDFAAGAFRRGLAATFTVHHPGQVVNSPKRSDHSLAEIAVRAPHPKFTYVEAGWLQSGTTRGELP